MGGRRGSGKSKRVKAGGQIPLGLTVAEHQGPPLPAGSAVFVDPRPDDIFVGTVTLRTFVFQQGLGWLDGIRRILRSLDWSDYLARYKPGGRQPYHPAGVVGLILLGHMTGRTSLRQMEELAKTDLRAWWLTGGVMPDYSSLCRFIQRHAQDLTEATFEQLTRRVLTALKSESKALYIDGTVVQAAASRYGLLKAEAVAHLVVQTRAAAAAAPDDVCLQKQASHAEVVHATVTERAKSRIAKGRKWPVKIALHEPGAVHQQLKEGGFAPSYKPSAAANPDRIIVAKQVEGSNEVQQVQDLLEQAQRVTSTQATTVAMDAGYNSAEVLDLSARLGLELLCPEGKTTGGEESWVAKKSLFGKAQFTYVADGDYFECPGKRRLVFLTRHGPAEGKPAYRQYKSKDCSGCPLASSCLHGKSKMRTVKRYSHDAAKDALRARMAEPDARRRYKKRQATIEPVHGEQKQLQGMRRFRRRGLDKVRIEYSLHCMAHNLRRFKALRRPRHGLCCARRTPRVAVASAATSIARQNCSAAVRGHLPARHRQRR